MRFRNYCIIVMGDVEGIKGIIKEVSEVNPRCLQQKGVLICTFSSVMEFAELKDLFNMKRTFFIFEVGNDTSAYNIGRGDIHNQLFGYMEEGGEEVLDYMTDKLMNDINESNKTSGNTDTIVAEEIDVTELTKSEIEIKINDLLDKGIENLDLKEKELLDLLTKNM